MKQQTSEATSENIKRALNNPSSAKTIDALISIIISKDQEWREAAKALGRIGFPEAGDKLVKIFLGKASESDPKLQALHWYDTAIAFLNCGNVTLVEASHSWAKSHGFTIIPCRGKAPVHWGILSTPLV